MKPLTFVKYQGTGNDFILLDNRGGSLRLSTEQIARLCHRRFGIGADGLMLLEAATGADFRMIYFNADGRESSMCGNGGRCIVAFAKRLGLLSGNQALFDAIDGRHEAQIETDNSISLRMNDVSQIEMVEGRVLLNTGSPHCIVWASDLNHLDVPVEGGRIRREARFGAAGINVNFVERLAEGRLAVRTYERGVEDETLSCGTGVTAAAIAASGAQTGLFAFDIETPGGLLAVRFQKDQPGSAHSVVLRGPAEWVFEGSTLPG